MNGKLPTIRNRTDYLICLALAGVTLAIYWQAFGFGFVMMDDTSYVLRNQHVLSGLTWDSVGWAIRSVYASNWHPLTWVSLMADAQVGGNDASIYHVTNVVLHVLNTLLLFGFLRIATGYRWRSAAVALLFAIHPLHVESVAWVTERKDVLSTLFWLLTMLAYAWYAKRRGVGRYLLVATLFALGLMAKPMLVSLPIVLLLIDIWPLKRISANDGGYFGRWWPLLREKIPLFALSAVSSLVTLKAQGAGGAVSTLQTLPLGVRVANAAVSYVQYVWKTAYPLKLMALYAHPGRSLPVWVVIGCGALMALATIAAIMCVRSRPYVIVGWLWYVLTLAPVIGLVQVGVQGMADRYSYVPTIGLFVILAWAVGDAAARLAVSRSPVLVTAVGVAFVGLMALCYMQVGYWRDSTALAEHAVAVEPGSYTARFMRGSAYLWQGQYSDAVTEFRRCLKIDPSDNQAHFGLAQALWRSGRNSESATEFRYTLKRWPRDRNVQYEAGLLLLNMRQADRALKHFRIALGLGYDYPGVYNAMGSAFSLKRDARNARKCFAVALSMDPRNVTARRGLAWADQNLRVPPVPISEK